MRCPKCDSDWVVKVCLSEVGLEDTIAFSAEKAIKVHQKWRCCNPRCGKQFATVR